MKGKQIVAIDVGSSNVVIAVGSLLEDGNVDILGIVTEPVSGVMSGRVENNEMVARAIATAKSKIEKQLNMHITEAYVAMSGDYIRYAQVEDHVYVQNEGITRHDLEELDRRMRMVPAPDDRETILSIEPLRYMIDDKETEEPIGTYGHVLKATYSFVLCEKKMRDRLAHCIKSQGITVKEFVPLNSISHLGIATTDEVADGAIVIDLGSGLTDVSVVQSGKVRYAASIPMGANAINDDIRSLSITKYVEDLKVGYGSAIADRCEDDLIVFPQKYHIMVKSILRRNLVIAIEARLMEIAGWVKKEIKEAKCGSRFRPAVLLTGGGSKMTDIEHLFARELGYDDVRVVYPEYGITSESQINHITTPAYSSVVSLLIYGAKRGLCAVSILPTPATPASPVTPAIAPKRDVVRPTIPPVREEPKPEPVEQSKSAGSVAPQQVDEAKDERITDAGPDVERPSKFKKLWKGWMNKMANSMSDDGDHDLE